jgi:hypothetical protein
LPAIDTRKDASSWEALSDEEASVEEEADLGPIGMDDDSEKSKASNKQIPKCWPERLNTIVSALRHAQTEQQVVGETKTRQGESIKVFKYNGPRRFLVMCRSQAVEQISVMLHSQFVLGRWLRVVDRNYIDNGSFTYKVR